MHTAATAPRIPAASVRVLLLCWLAGLTLGLSACASTRVVDSEVRSFSGSVAATTPASYRFDRLPSQTGDDRAQAAQERLEALADAALADVGLTQSDSNTRYLAQISATVEQIARTPVRRPFMPFAPFSPFPPMGMGGVGGFHQAPLGFGTGMEPPWSRYLVHIVLRDASTGQVVFESAAQHTGPWADAANIVPAVLRAALRDYPNTAPQGSTVRVEVGPQGLTDLP